MKKFLPIITVIICGLYTHNATAQCPEGCFCFDDIEGEVSDSDICMDSASLASSDESSGWTTNYRGITISSSPDAGRGDYYLDEFSELYLGSLGFYGFRNNEFIYRTAHYTNSVMLQCPNTHPHSASGAKALTDCFKYDANGNKIYYGADQTIHCNAGTYLPANATSCSNCSVSQNHICPGGNFARSDTVQGLKVNCNPGQYLPANTTNCVACDNNYSCSGGIYSFNANIDQGLTIQHNGYINATKSNGGLHQYTTCNPGQYMPAKSTTCTSCVGDYACPGGIFYTDATYNKDRGRILCSYGTANSTHTACIPQSTQPSYMKGKISNTNDIVASTEQNTNNSTTSPTTTTNTIQSTTPSITVQKPSLTQATPEKKFDFGNLVSPFADRSATQQKRQPVQTTHGRATRITPQIKKATIQPQSAQQSPAHRSNNNPHRPSPRQ